MRASAAQHGESARTLQPSISALRDLLSEPLLLDPPDHAERAQSLERACETSRAARAEVSRVFRFAEIVDANVVVLRVPPLTADDIAALRLRADELRQRRDNLGAVIDALEYVRANAGALDWSEVPPRLAANQALVPALGAQLSDADAVQQRAQENAENAEKSHQDATSGWQSADGKRILATQAHEKAKTNFESYGIPAPSEEVLRIAAEEVTHLEAQLRGVDKRRDELLDSRGGQKAALVQAEGQVKAAEEKLTSERREAEPAVTRWERLRERAHRHGLLATVLNAGETDLTAVRGHVNLVQPAQTHRTLLLERLRGAQGGAALLTEIAVLRNTSDVDFGEGLLELWLTVRDWLRHRLPAQIAEVDDPREGLIRLRDQLSSLEERLRRQEKDLRGSSEDVARGIDVQIRKARGQVKRLTQNLDGVSFGSIRGIRVRLTTVERMEQVLRALRERSAQGILFQEDLPIEDALDEIFRRYGGARTGGQRLLDYREYVNLQVEIRRKAGADWESANPTRVSTGEAIGIGAALMMVVLTEWERDSTLLRGRRSQGSLRFLFLDEANRLSQDNLSVLFDLCQTLELQLLIAAPEVARAEGNTTYRLVRRLTADGREEVLVSGRRTRAEAWGNALIDIAAHGLPATPEGWNMFQDAQRADSLPPLPDQLNWHTAAALTGPHSKSTLTERRMLALRGTESTHDGTVRLRPPRGLTARTRRGTVDLAAIADVLDEVAIPERAFKDGLQFLGKMSAVLLVENLGAWRDLPKRDDWLLAHVPGWDTATASQFLDRVGKDVPVIHFGDLDPNGVRIFVHLRERRRDLRWFVPSFWREFIKSNKQRNPWPSDLARISHEV